MGLKKRWIKGGLLGFILCVILFLFYIYVYFPMINAHYAEDIETYGGTPAWTTVPPLITGHFFPMLSGFIVPYGFMCEFTEPVCTYWSIDPEYSSVPWTMDGQAGYCIEQTLTPTDACATASEHIGFWALASALGGVYFAIGAIIGNITEKKKET